MTQKTLDDFDGDDKPSRKQVKQMWRLKSPQPARLLEHYSSLDEIGNAAQEELEEIPSIGEATARKIVEDDVTYRATEQTDIAATDEDALTEMPAEGDRIRVVSRETDDDWVGEVISAEASDAGIHHEEFWLEDEEEKDEKIRIVSRKGGEGAWRSRSEEGRFSVDFYRADE